MYFIITVGAFLPITVRGLIYTYARGFIINSHLVSATVLYYLYHFRYNLCRLIIYNILLYVYIYTVLFCCLALQVYRICAVK